MPTLRAIRTPPQRTDIFESKTLDGSLFRVYNLARDFVICLTADTSETLMKQVASLHTICQPVGTVR